MVHPFAKYEALGNDFMVVEADAWPFETFTASRVTALCDRHRGVGADGILWLGPPEEAGQDARLVIWNADGSRPEMCGNGVRCVAAYLADRGRLAPGASFALGTDAGMRRTRVLPRETPSPVRPADSLGSHLVDVDMGPVIVTPEPVRVAVGGRSLALVAVDVGNPHAVLFDPRAHDGALEDTVRVVEARRDVFPNGVNVEFVTLASARGPGRGVALDVRVHERGVGWTQACGTGACAVAAAAVTGRWHPTMQPDSLVEVHFGDGVLEIAVAQLAGSLRTRMRGAARRVFDGTLGTA